jgi:hypothetical protein
MEVEMYSGRTAGQRHLPELLAKVAAGDTVIVSKLSQLGRSLGAGDELGAESAEGVGPGQAEGRRHEAAIGPGKLNKGPAPRRGLLKIPSPIWGRGAAGAAAQPERYFAP